MNVQAWDEIVDNASNLVNRLDKHGNIFDSTNDEITNFKIINEFNMNKIDIMSLLYNIASCKNGQ